MKSKGSGGVHATGLIMVLVSGALLPDGFGQTYSGPMSVEGYVQFHRGGYAIAYPASYTMTGGRLTPQSLLVELARFDQLGGTNRVAENLQIQQGWFSDYTVYRLRGGRLVTSNTFTHTYSAYSPGIRGFEQSGGTHVVRGTLSVQSSSYAPYPGGYTFSGGELVVNNLEVGGNAIFWQGGGRLTNNGTITLAGGHWKRGPLAQRTQRFGRLQLQAKTNSSFTFSTGALATVRFAASAATAWNPQARLIFHGWQGLTTGGGQHQIYFGTNRNGLTPQQLSQIRFRDPKGFEPGEYPARHRGTGEIVPNARPVITLTRDGQDILVQWPAGYVLQTATNVPGPFSDVEATSPYRRPTASESQRYFRLRQ